MSIKEGNEHMKNNSKNSYILKLFRGLKVKTDNKFVEICLGIGILMFCSAPMLYAIANILKIYH
jgi:hypothetical protein